MFYRRLQRSADEDDPDQFADSTVAGAGSDED